jgi:glutathione S-transferase
MVDAAMAGDAAFRHCLRGTYDTARCAGQSPWNGGISATGKVPFLIAHEAAGDLVLWESLAVLAYLAELSSYLPLWPADAADRAGARVVSHHMHGSLLLR